MNGRNAEPVAKLLADAQRAAGERAADAAAAGDYTIARQWAALACELGALIRDAVELLIESTALGPGMSHEGRGRRQAEPSV